MRTERWALLSAKLLFVLLPFVTAVLPAQQTVSAPPFAPAQAGYTYQFPRDHFNHPEYQTEWWYYTGNLRAKDGHRFGFELTFFREGVSRAAARSTWDVRDVYMAHLALSDVTGKHYYESERLNRSGPGLAGVDAASETVWNGNWQTVIAPGAHHLVGVGEGFSIDLNALPETAPVIHGVGGVSQKSAGLGHASHYISFPTMKTTGTVELGGTTFAVDGDTWMDHEFFTEPMDGGDVGWDWLSLQLDDRSELMLYRLRHKDGSVDPYSSGTYIDRDGKATHLALDDFTMTKSGESWKSNRTAATYPVAWNVTIPELKLQLDIKTPLPTQEFVSRFGPSYWEGAIDISGHRGDAPVRGEGYLEMTGYSDSRSPLVSR